MNSPNFDHRLTPIPHTKDQIQEGNKPLVRGDGTSRIEGTTLKSEKDNSFMLRNNNNQGGETNNLQSITVLNNEHAQSQAGFSKPSRFSVCTSTRSMP
jgi:hypothetical protein